jgi:hypothetical protein
MGSAEPFEREWTVNLELDDARLRCSYRRRGKQIEQYTAQLEVHHEGAWKPVVRFDNVHGFDHCDIVHGDGTREKAAVIASDPNAAFTRAIKALRANSREHREPFQREGQT